MVNIDRYIENVNRCNELNNMKIDGKADILTQIFDLSKKLREIKAENDEIVKQTVALDNTELDSESRHYLNDKCEELSNFNQQIDNSFSYVIREILYHDALLRKDNNDIIKQLYFCGVGHYYIFKNLNDVKNPYFEKMKEYLPLYGTLNKESKRLLISGYSNRIVNYNYVDSHKVISIGKENLEIYKKIDEKFPGELNVNLYNLVTYRNIATCIEDFDKLDKDEVSTIKFAIEESFKLLELADKTTSPNKTNYIFSEYLLEYRLNAITLKDLVEKLKLLSVPDKSLPESENFSRLFDVGSSYLSYARKLYTNDKDFDLVKKEWLDRVRKDSKKLKISDSTPYIDEKILVFIKGTAEVITYDEIKDMVYNITVYRHRSTYIHSNMVNKLSLAILDGVHKYSDSSLKEIYDLPGFESYSKIRSLMDEMSIMHDIGKWLCMEYISISYRKLFDFEFQVIKEHPGFGYDLLKDFKICEGIKDGILLHQLSYDGKSGYPMAEKKSQYKVLVDILTLADCLDAGTDFVGRPYSKIKHLDDILAEFDQGISTKYTPLAKILHNDDVYANINDILNNFRLKLIKEVYVKD